jgi:hypothetical protein
MKGERSIGKSNWVVRAEAAVHASLLNFYRFLWIYLGVGAVRASKVGFIFLNKVFLLSKKKRKGKKEEKK